jgi:hypothetical protein
MHIMPYTYKTREDKMIKKKNKISKLEQTRSEVLESLLRDEELIEGSYSEILVTCGRAGCHCEKKPVHLVTRLGVREDGKIKNKVVRVADREKVKDLTSCYREHKKALQELERINMEEREILKELIKEKNIGYS